MDPRSCLTCKHSHWTDDDGEPQSSFRIAQKIRECGNWLYGQCSLNPEWIKVRADHYCGQYLTNLYIDGSAETYIDGSRMKQENVRLKDENVRLKAQYARLRGRYVKRRLENKKLREANRKARARSRAPGVAADTSST